VDARLARWLEALVATPGLTAIADPEEARRVHVEDALAALPVLGDGPVVDVGSGGGSPGLPLAVARPDLGFTLLEATRRKCAFLVEQATVFPNVRVVCDRAEVHGRGEGRDAYGTAVARALATPAVALEWCLPLVRPEGICVLYAGEAGAGPGLGEVCRELGAAAPEVYPTPGADRRVLLVARKLTPTPERFPRRPGVAKKRPLGPLA